MYTPQDTSVSGSRRRPRGRRPGALRSQATRGSRPVARRGSARVERHADHRRCYACRAPWRAPARPEVACAARCSPGSRLRLGLRNWKQWFSLSSCLTTTPWTPRVVGHSETACVIPDLDAVRAIWVSDSTRSRPPPTASSVGHPRTEPAADVERLPARAAVVHPWRIHRTAGSFLHQEFGEVRSQRYSVTRAMSSMNWSAVYVPKSVRATSSSLRSISFSRRRRCRRCASARR